MLLPSWSMPPGGPPQFPNLATSLETLLYEHRQLKIIVLSGRGLKFRFRSSQRCGVIVGVMDEGRNCKGLAERGCVVLRCLRECGEMECLRGCGVLHCLRGCGVLHCLRGCGVSHLWGVVECCIVRLAVGCCNV